MNLDGVLDGEVVFHVLTSVAEAVVDRPQWCAHTGVRWGHQNGSYQKQASQQADCSGQLNHTLWFKSSPHSTGL